MSSIHLLRIPQRRLGTGPLQHEPSFSLRRQRSPSFFVEPPLLGRRRRQAGLFGCCLLAVHGSSARCAGSRASVPRSTVAAMARRGQQLCARETPQPNRARTPHLNPRAPRPEYVSEGRIRAPAIAGNARKTLRGGRLDNKNTSRRATPLVAARRTAGRRSARLRSVAPRARRSLQTEPRALSLRAKHWRPLLCLARSARRRPPQHCGSGAR